MLSPSGTQAVKQAHHFEAMMPNPPLKRSAKQLASSSMGYFRARLILRWTS